MTGTWKHAPTLRGIDTLYDFFSNTCTVVETRPWPFGVLIRAVLLIFSIAFSRKSSVETSTWPFITRLAPVSHRRRTTLKIKSKGDIKTPKQGNISHIGRKTILLGVDTGRICLIETSPRPFGYWGFLSFKGLLLKLNLLRKHSNKTN